MKPVIQVALDFIDLPRALQVAREAVQGGADWLEAGTPLIKSVGLDSVRKLRELFPGKTIVADLKTFDAGRLEVEMAAKAGADIVCVLGNAPDATLKECVLAGRNYGARIMADLLGVESVEKRALELVGFGIDYLNIHLGIDEQMQGRQSFDLIQKLSRRIEAPLAAAGGLNTETAVRALKAGASIFIVGGAITKSSDAAAATRLFKKALKEKRAVKTELYRRVGPEGLLEILGKVSTANLSDARHRAAGLEGIRPVHLWKNLKMAGPALTVRTYPGDWAKPVEAVDQAEPGQVIVIEAGGRPPAVWGELATSSAVVKKLAGVVIDGAIRDTSEIAELKFPAFSRLVCPHAGEPKGLGEIGVPVTIGGQRVINGDWVVGDADGIMVIPRAEAVEFANRAMDVLEKENRLREEIQRGGTLAQITELLKWEKH